MPTSSDQDQGEISHVEFRSLGATGLKVSVLSFATMSFVGKLQSVIGTTDLLKRGGSSTAVWTPVSICSTRSTCTQAASLNGCWARRSRDGATDCAGI